MIESHLSEDRWTQQWNYELYEDKNYARSCSYVYALAY